MFKVTDTDGESTSNQHIACYMNECSNKYAEGTVILILITDLEVIIIT